MKRFVGGLVLTIVILGVAATPAHAGGSTFSFHDRWLAPGQVVVGRTEFSDWEGATGRVAQGPYFAYLIRGDASIDPPHIPSGAIRLGMVRMVRHHDTFWAASIRFVVPSLRPGQYTVSLCNDPCRISSVGDLVGGWVHIAASVQQAKARNMERRIADRVMQGMSPQLEDMSVQLQQLRDAVDSVPRSGITVGTQMRLTPIEEQLTVLAAQVRDLRSRTDQGLPAWLWLAGWLVAAGIAAGWWRSRRRVGLRGRSRFERAELETVVAPVHLDRVPVADLTRQ